MDGDYLKRSLDDKQKLRVYTAVTTLLAREITGRHRTTPNATTALTDTLTATALLSAGLKPESRQSIAVKFHGEGPIRIVQAQADSLGHVRGYVAVPDIDTLHDLGAIDFSLAIGAGMLTITRNLGRGEPYSGTVPLLYGNVARDVVTYLLESDQIPSALILARNLDDRGAVTLAAGILIQSLPDTEPEILENLEVALGNAPSLTGFLSGNAGLDDYCTRFLGLTGTGLSVTGLSHHCSCSRDYLASVIASLDPGELADMARDPKGTEAVCSFCRAVYIFSPEEIVAMIRTSGKPQ